MLRRSFFFRVVAGVVAVLGLRLSGGSQAELWGARQPQPMTLYVRFVEKSGYNVLEVRGSHTLNEMCSLL